MVMLRDNDGFKFHKLFSTTALPDLPAKPRVVDIACGFGKSTRPLVSRYPDALMMGKAKDAGFIMDGGFR
jgi:trans-aconitate methyltransferase